MRTKTNKSQPIKEMFSFFKITKRITNDDELKSCRNTQYLCKFLMLLTLVCGCMMLLGGIFCIATFNVDKATSILLIVFGIILGVIGTGLLLVLHNITARIDSYKLKGVTGA
ncbi:MAG: hypothetical protein LBV53_00105 [Mycoplasmataceae bacterium]|jgi:hypothetical protein|nr:hypothetical protein [Mycoplasmataceae bacterium]